MHTMIQKKNITFKNIAIYSLCATCFSIPLSSSFTAIFSVLFFIGWLGSGTIEITKDLVKSNTFSISCLALFFILIMGVFYSAAPLPVALEFLKKYRILLFVPLIIGLCHGNQQIRDHALYSFIAGCTLLLLISYVMFIFYPGTRNYPTIINKINHNGFMAFCSFFFLQQFLNTKTGKYWWLTLFIITSINVFYIVTGGTGQLIYITLAFFFATKYFSVKKQILAFLAIIIICIGVYSTSNVFSGKINHTIETLSTYDTEAMNGRKSVELRLNWWINCLQLAKEKPILGHGTGSMRYAQETLDPVKNGSTMKTSNPHNEYLFILEQVGIVGLSFFLLILLIPFIHAKKLPIHNQILLQSVVLTMVVGSFFNSWLLDSPPSHFYTLLTAILWDKS